MKKPHAYYKALNKDGNLVFAKSDEAIEGVEYFCRYCECRMKLIPGRYFIRIPGEKHSNKKCIAYENGRKEFGFADKTPEELISKFCQIERKVTKKPKPYYGGDEPFVIDDVDEDDNPQGLSPDDIDEDDNPQESNPDDDIDENDNTLDLFNSLEDGIEKKTKETAYDSLKRIYEEEFEDFKYDSKVGRYRLSDYVLTYSYAGKVLRRRNYELGYRIVYARFYAYSEYGNILTFRLFAQHEESCALFKLHIADDESYLGLLDIFAPNTEDTKRGTTRRVKAKRDVLIAANWKKKSKCKTKCFLSKDYTIDGKVIRKACFDSQCIGEWNAEIINAGRQVYVIPSDGE